MGCDIHMYGEKRTDSGFGIAEFDRIYSWRCYNTFAFLADVRNNINGLGSPAYLKPLDKPRGLPADVSPITKSIYQNSAECFGSVHSPSWFLTEELVNIDYDTPYPIHGGSEPLRVVLCGAYFELLEFLKEYKIDRVVFWFDC